MNGNGWLARHWIVIGVVLMTGCTAVRWPTLAPRPPQFERRAYNLHDPFPDEASGPETFTRPREFVQERTETQTDRDLRMLRSQQLPPAAIPLQPAPGYGVPMTPGPTVPPPTYAVPEG